MPDNSALLPVGRITKAHGIRGELALVLNAESANILDSGLWLRPSAETPARAFEIRHLRVHHGALLVSLKGVENRNQAELLRGHQVLAPRSQLPPLEEGEVYLGDLPGLRVLAAENGAEREIGVIASVDTPAGQDIWTIRTPEGEALFPAAQELILEINVAGGFVRIDPPPGLFELYLAGGGSPETAG